MRKLYNEFFYVPKYGKGKVREKVMLARTALTVVIMVVCLAAMGITAYAYFAYNVTSASNIIKAANFETKVSIQISDSNNEPVPVEQLNSKTQVATLSAGKEYSVTIEKAGTAQTGFCVISAEGCDVEKYHTQQIGKDVKSNTEGTNSITFTLTVTDTTDVTFYSHWGTSTYYADYEDKGDNDVLYIIDGETVNLIINGVTNPVGNEDDDKKDEETTPPTTTPTEVVHTVASGESLSKIAGMYNTTVDRITAYNKITDPDSIQAGQQIKIPPADWVMPEQPKETTPPATETTTPPPATTEPSTTPATTEPTVTEPSTTEPSETEQSDSTETTTQQTDTTEPEETQPTEETTGAPTTEANSE